MKNYALRILSLLLVVATLSLMISCDLSSVLGDIAPDDLGNGVQNGTTNDVKFTFGTIKETTERKTNIVGEPTFIPPMFIDSLNFEGEELTVLYRDNIQNSREWFKEEPEDELEEAIVQRNEKVEEELNIHVRFEPVPANAGYDAYAVRLTEMICNDVDADLHNYDISANHSYATAYASIRDYTSNLLDSELFPYFDFELPCWNQSIINDTTPNKKLHYVAGDLNISMFDAAIVMWHNVTLYDRYKENTDPENMQELALDGFWTYEELYRWSTRMYENSNGIEGRQEDDTYGLLIDDSRTTVDAFPTAWDISFIKTDIDGTHLLEVAGNQKAEDALERCRIILNGQGTYATTNTLSFANGSALFYMGALYKDHDSNMAMREMYDKYGLMPMPKYDNEQAQYSTTAYDYFTLMFVLNHSESSIATKGEAVSAYLELATEESYTSVRGYYFNRIVKPKYFGTDDTEGTVTKSIAIFDIIVSNINFELYNIYSPQLNNFAWLWRDTVNDESTLQSAYAKNANSYNKAMLELDAWFGLIILAE